MKGDDEEEARLVPERRAGHSGGGSAANCVHPHPRGPAFHFHWPTAAIVAGAACLLLGLAAALLHSGLGHVMQNWAVRKAGAEGGAGGALSAPPPVRQPPQLCELPINQTAFAGACTLLQDVCVDQVGQKASAWQ